MRLEAGLRAYASQSRRGDCSRSRRSRAGDIDVGRSRLVAAVAGGGGAGGEGMAEAGGGGMNVVGVEGPPGPSSHAGVGISHNRNMITAMPIKTSESRC